MQTRVERGNVVLYVEPYEVEHYLQLGYDVTDDNGKVLQGAIPHDMVALQKYYVEYTAKIEELEKTIAKLTTELNNLKSSKPAPAKTNSKK